VVPVVDVSPPLRYVVLRHEGIDDPHFDLMLEMAPGGPLATWRAPHWPPSYGDYFVRLPDHRNSYLEYEGPVSGNRGHVARCAAGTCEALLTVGLLQVKFTGGDELTLVKDSPGQWLCIVVDGGGA
jgi:hypothetical protein